MPIVKRALASLAALGLLASQPAAATPAGAARQGTTLGTGEDLAGIPEGSAPVIAIISLLALTALVALIVGTHDDDEAPQSP